MRNLIVFPPKIVSNQKSAFLDNAATSLKFKRVISSIVDCYKNYPFNLHSLSSTNYHSVARKVIFETKEKFANFLNCNSKNIFFTPSCSYSLNFLALSFSKVISSNKEKVLLTKLEHSSNVYPWINIGRLSGIKVEYANLNEKFSVDKQDLKQKVDNNTKIFSFCHVSNNLGIKNNIKELTEIVRQKSPNCIVIVDGSQSISSEKPNLEDWDIDVFVFSCHKFYSSCGLGIMWMSERAKNFFPEIFWGGAKEFGQEKQEEKIFEVGTLPAAELFGVHQAISIVESIDLEKLKLKRKKLRDYLVKELVKMKKVSIYNRDLSESIVLFNLEKFHSHDIANFLARNFVYVRAGNFCSPFISEIIGVNSAVRVSIALYNNKSEIDLFLSFLKSVNFKNII